MSEEKYYLISLKNVTAEEAKEISEFCNERKVFGELTENVTFITNVEIEGLAIGEGEVNEIETLESDAENVGELKKCMEGIEGIYSGEELNLMGEK